MMGLRRRRCTAGRSAARAWLVWFVFGSTFASMAMGIVSISVLPLQLAGPECREIGRPFDRLVAAQFVQIVPAEKPRVVAVVEADAHRVIPHGLEGFDCHAPLAGDD